jgi:hypothetical protein
MQVGLPLMDGVAGPAGATRPAPEEPGREGNITLPEDRVTPASGGLLFFKSAGHYFDMGRMCHVHHLVGSSMWTD